MKKCLKIKVIKYLLVILFMLFFVKSTLLVASPSLYGGISYGYGEFINPDIDYVFSNFHIQNLNIACFEFFTKFGFVLDMWTLKQDCEFDIASISQVGISGELIFDLISNNNFSGYVGGGYGFQHTEIKNNWYGSNTDERGYASNVILGCQYNYRRIGFYGETKSSSAESEDLDDGSFVVKLGIRFRFYK